MLRPQVPACFGFTFTIVNHFKKKKKKKKHPRVLIETAKYLCLWILHPIQCIQVDPLFFNYNA